MRPTVLWIARNSDGKTITVIGALVALFFSDTLRSSYLAAAIVSARDAKRNLQAGRLEVAAEHAGAARFYLTQALGLHDEKALAAYQEARDVWLSADHCRPEQIAEPTGDVIRTLHVLGRYDEAVPLTDDLVVLRKLSGRKGCASG